MKYRIIYKKRYESESEALKAAKELKGKASNPAVYPGLKAGWLVVLYESNKYSMIEKGVSHYKSAGLTVFIQKVA